MSGKMVFAIAVGLLSLLVLQGAAPMVAGWAGEAIGQRGIASVELMKIYSTSNVIRGVSAYGSTVAWSETFQRNASVSDTDIVVYSGGSTHTYGKRGISEVHPAVGNIVVWEELPETSGDAKIVGTTGIIFSQAGASGEYPAVDGLNVVYIISGTQGDGVGYTISGNQGSFSVDREVDVVDISGNYISWNREIYSLQNHTSWSVLNVGTILRISGDRVLFSGRSDFGKSVYMGVMNFKTGEEDVFIHYQTGLYGGIDSSDFDGSYVIWCYEGAAHLYNVYSKETYDIAVSGTVTHVAIGGGTLVLVTSDGSGYAVWKGNVPAAGSFVEVTLKDPGYNTPDSEPHRLMVTDSQGRRFGGWNPSANDIYREIPGAMVVVSGEVTVYRIPTTAPDSLSYRVTGGHDGTYSLSVRGYVLTRGIKFAWVNATDISIHRGEIQSYIINWQKVMDGSSSAVKISIDTNGDGTVDRTVASGASITNATVNGSGSSGLFSLASGVWLLVIVAVLVLVVVALVLHSRKKK